MIFRRTLFKIGNIFCIIPRYEFQKEELKHSKLNKFYIFSCGITFAVMVIAIQFHTPTQAEEINIFEQLLASITNVISFCLIEYLIFSPEFIKRYDWQMFMKKYLLAQENAAECTCYGIKIQFIVAHCYFIATFGISMYAWISFISPDCILELILSLIVEYYCVLYALITGNIALSMKCLYEDINKTLKTKTETCFLVTPQGRLEGYLNTVLYIGKRFRNVAELLSYYNKIFGLATLLILWHSVIQILRCANVVWVVMDDQQCSWMMSALVVMGFLKSMGESVYIIMCCEKATSAGNKLRQLCHQLQENFDIDSKARKELFKLAEVAKSYKPKFTAANFFVINQGVILKILSIATTYLIVIIQFYGTVKERYLRERSDNKTN